MEGLSNLERACVERAQAAQDAMLARTLDWAAINSGSRNLAGLETVGRAIGDALAVLPGAVEWVDPATVEAVDATGRKYELPHGKHLRLTVRPDAPLQLLFTGHMDTVFPLDHAFQDMDHPVRRLRLKQLLRAQRRARQPVVSAPAFPSASRASLSSFPGVCE